MAISNLFLDGFEYIIKEKKRREITTDDLVEFENKRIREEFGE